MFQVGYRPQTQAFLQPTPFLSYSPPLTCYSARKEHVEIHIRAGKSTVVLGCGDGSKTSHQKDDAWDTVMTVSRSKRVRLLWRLWAAQGDMKAKAESTENI